MLTWKANFSNVRRWLKNLPGICNEHFLSLFSTAAKPGSFFDAETERSRGRQGRSFPQVWSEKLISAFLSDSAMLSASALK
jgi:hypothetical protein